jgi:hypothetical protein
MDGKVTVLRDPGSELDTIQTLYFPELAVEVSSFVAIFNEQIAAGTKLIFKLMQAGPDDGARRQAYDEFSRRYDAAFFESRQKAMQSVKSSARRLLVGIMGVP